MAYALDAYEAAFATLGYVRCPSEELEPGVEKIAIFIDGPGQFHAARQLPTGMWSSKLGAWEDISHPLRQLEGADPIGYGSVARIMSRPTSG